MKKLILGLVIVMALTLSGCGEENWEDMSDLQKDIYCENTENIVEARCTIWNNLENEYYTKEEVNQMLDQQASDIMEIIYDNYVEYDEVDKVLYSNCLIVDGLKKCDIVLDLNKDFVTIEEYQASLNRIEELEELVYDEFSWLDYNAILYNVMNERLEVYFYEDDSQQNYFLLDIVLDYENSQAIINIYHNEENIHSDIDSFNGTILELIEDIQQEVFDKNINYLWFYDYYNIGVGE